ncbi:MAG: hypothetical protein ACI85I_001412 [Arenicella sp.]|jgi:hypothetical protein
MKNIKNKSLQLVQASTLEPTKSKKASRLSSYILILLAIIIFSSCEDPIDISLGDPIPQLTVDAFITDQVQTQTVRLTVSQQYFANTFNPVASGATVVLKNETTNDEFAFTDSNSNGDYTFENLSEMPLITLGDTYKLSISYDGEDYEAFSLAKRNVPIDSISYELKEEELGQNEGYYAQINVTDLGGLGTAPDFYRIRTWKSDASTGKEFWLNNPGEISISADGTFDPNSRGETDAFQFILPIRESINPEIDEDSEEAPYDLGDSIFVELHSIDVETYDFFSQLQEQVNNGGLFATPLANVPTNIENTNSNAPIEKQAVGWFGVSLVNSEGVKIIE